MAALSPFDYVKAINQSKRPLIDMGGYAPYIVNRALSRSLASILQANAMNQRAWLEPDMQFCYLLNGVRASGQWTKWVKAQPPDPDVQLVAESLDVSLDRAEQLMNLVNEAQLQQLKAQAGSVVKRARRKATTK